MFLVLTCQECGYFLCMTLMLCSGLVISKPSKFIIFSFYFTKLQFVFGVHPDALKNSSPDIRIRTLNKRPSPACISTSKSILWMLAVSGLKHHA